MDKSAAFSRGLEAGTGTRTVAQPKRGLRATLWESLKPVPKSADGGQVTRIIRLRFDVLPQAPDVDIHRPRRDEALLAPNLLQKLIAAVGPARMRQKELQQLVLGGGQVQFAAAQKNAVRAAIQLERPGLDSGIFLLVPLGRAQGGLPPGPQLARAERLGHGVVAADLQPQHPIDFI